MEIKKISEISGREQTKNYIDLTCTQCITYVFCKPMIDKLKKPLPENTGSRILAIMDLRDKCSIFNELILKLAQEENNDGCDPL